jgi:colanic acid biosynthesis glycosyl transferase WcaI
MRVLFLNQYFPPDPAPTGILFAELADACRARGHDVAFVDAGQDYREAAQHQKGGRMKRELAALRRMLRAGKAQPRADVVVSGSSPPCLAVFADRVARRHRARHFHWAMDVYPEIAIALGEVRAGSLVARITSWLMGRAYRRCAAVVALDADMAAALSRHGVKPVCIRPWVFAPMLQHLAHHTTGDREYRSPGSGFCCLYSGNLGRAHDYETLLRAQKLLEEKGAGVRLKFQGGGPGTTPAKSLAAELGLKACEFTGYAPEDSLVPSLLAHDVLAVTQRPETQGMLWPSKLGLITALPRPILFIGPTTGAIADDLRRLPQAGVFEPGDAAGVAQWLQTHRSNPSIPPQLAAPAAHRTQAIAEWVRLIERGAMGGAPQ